MYRDVSVMSWYCLVSLLWFLVSSQGLFVRSDIDKLTYVLRLGIYGLEVN